MRIRLSLLRIRRRLRSYRLVVWTFVTALVTVLGTAYEDIPESLRTATLIVLGVLTGLTVLLGSEAGDRGRGGSGPGQLVTPGDSDADHRRTFRGWRADRPRRRWRLRRRGRWWWIRPRRTPIPVLPAGDGMFAGRDREIRDLLDRHSQARRRRGAARSVRRADRVGQGPILILIHGRAGVGKTVFAAELARKLADEYRDGQMFANLGTGGAARRPADVLQDMLALLGWQDEEMPAELDKRAKLFRALTAGRRLLIVLDAARDGNQLFHLLPRDPGCTVIVTSRRDLSGNIDSESQSYRLDPPDLADSLEILHAVSQVPLGSRQPYAVRITQLCGALPLALRSAGERVAQDGTHIGHVASLLEPAGTRLSWLDRPGRAVTEGIQIQYDRALRTEQQALKLLTLVPSATFFPWVLRPLLNVSFAEAEALVTRLAGAQLLEELATRDTFQELPRYRFHPLDRLFVDRQVAELPIAARESAQQRLAAAYYEFVVRVLRSATAGSGAHWVPADSDLPKRIAERPDQWVRAEYANLLRVIDTAAGRGDHHVCWEAGAWLGGCVPDNPDIGAILDAFAIALDAARRYNDDLPTAGIGNDAAKDFERAPTAAIDVLLARGAFHAAVEDYGSAETTFQEAIALAQALLADRTTGPEVASRAALRVARAHRKRGEAFLQAASYRLACEAFDDATRIATLASNQRLPYWKTSHRNELRLARLLTAEARQADLVDSDYDELLDDSGQPDAVHFRVLLSLAEVERRRGDWRTAANNLERARHLATDDQRGLATLHYRLSRLALHQYHVAVRQQLADSDPASLANQAVRHATEALLVFERMGNPAGLIRARCQLARALLHSRRAVEAEQVISLAHSELDELKDMPPYAVDPLRARVLRSRGELALVNRDPAARALLTAAAQLYGGQDDWAAQSEILLLVERQSAPV